VIVMQLVNGRYVDEKNPEEEPAPELVASGREPFRVNRWLVAALVVAVAVAGVFAGLMYLEHRQTPDERAVAEVLAKSIAAWDVGDATAVLKTMTPDGTWAGVEDLAASAGNGPYSGVDLAGFVREMDAKDFHLTATGPLTILAGERNWTVAQPARLRFTQGAVPVTVQSDGWMLSTVVDDHGTKLISRMVWWPTSSRLVAPQ
jgi:hypothetical protein